MDRETRVAMMRPMRLTGVDADAYGDGSAVTPGVLRERTLRSNRGPDSLACATEGNEERVALRFYLRSVVLGERRTQQRSMRREYIGIVLVQPLHELGRPGASGKRSVTIPLGSSIMWLHPPTDNPLRRSGGIGNVFSPTLLGGPVALISVDR